MRCRCCLTRSTEPVPYLDETPTRMPYIRAPYLGLDETGHLTEKEPFRSGARLHGFIGTARRSVQTIVFHVA